PHLHAGNRVTRAVEGLRLVQVRVHELRVVLVEASFENALYPKLLGHWRSQVAVRERITDRRRRHLDAIAYLDGQRVLQRLTDHDTRQLAAVALATRVGDDAVQHVFVG